jgi:phosphodiester glycosidase
MTVWAALAGVWTALTRGWTRTLGWVRSRRWTRKSMLWRVPLTVLLVMAVLTAWSIGDALLRPGTDPASARLAEWARDHGLGRVVTWLENEQYKSNKPRKGGGLDKSLQSQLHGGDTAPTGHGLPKPIAPLVQPALPDEGVWKVADLVNGQPVVLRALLRPDPDHTSYLAYVAWIKSSATRFELHPGSDEPGHPPWNTPDYVPSDQRANLVATFNGGFRLKDALPGGYGGYYADSRTIGTLKLGDAAEIFYADGHMSVGQWGRDASVTSTGVIAVRENLQLLVDNGQVQANIADGSSATWGYTIKNAYYVWRSGVGVTADGNIVYAMGPTLSVATLATILQRAGAVRAMELDINPTWVSFMTYAPPAGGSDPVPTKLMDFSRPADRYYHPSSRDFVAVYAK